MGQHGSSTPHIADGASAADRAWSVVLDAACRASALAEAGAAAAFAIADDRTAEDLPLVAVALSDRSAALFWSPAAGWELRLPTDDPRHPHIDLYLPVCSATPSRPITVGHLGQSLDGFIATHSGDSQFVTGPENIRHLHRMRALSDAIVVGAGTVAADDPQLTTRHVAGPNPLRVVLDPGRRLGEHYKVFSDDAVETIYVCGRSAVHDGETAVGHATILPVDERDGTIDVTAILPLLRARGCHRIFVEGGGVTVSMFLEAGLLDRLQVAVAPLIIGDGRPAVRLPAPDTLRECQRPDYRVFRMGGDVFFDCDLTAAADGNPGAQTVTRII
jgi:diaminohydroxyphosphoribosylaminopyrimidine deaminase / 5-amino-6-(5-phosphoribosylamino)uracil reductase